MRLICPCCPNVRQTGHYMCRNCWSALPADTRSRLNRRDDRAFARLRELHAAIATRTPLRAITVSR